MAAITTFAKTKNIRIFTLIRGAPILQVIKSQIILEILSLINKPHLKIACHSWQGVVTHRTTPSLATT